MKSKRSLSSSRFQDQEEFLRLNKYLAKWAGVSRRSADRLVKEGQVFLNGRRVESLGLKVHIQKDKVKIKNRLIVPHLSANSVYFMFNKPEKVLTTAADLKGRPVVMDFFKKSSVRLFPVGRLDWHSEGLLLLTNDGDFTQKILHPRQGIPKTYLVKIKGSLKSQQKAKLLKGVPTPFGKKKALFVEKVPKSSHTNTWIKIIIAEGKNRQLRLMLQNIGCMVIRLKRTAIGRLRLGALKKGTYLPLREKDLHKVFLRPSELRRS